MPSPNRRRALLGLISLGGLGVPAASQALTDLLTIPARRSALAPRSVMLGVTQAGQRLVAVGERGLIVTSDDAGQRWQQSQVPVSVTLTAVAFADARRGWAVGHDGVILHSADSGQTWSLQFDGRRANAALLKVREAAVPAATTPEQREQAENALADMQDSAKFGPSRPFLGVCVQKTDGGEQVWVAGAFGQLFASDDGGRNWAEAAAGIDNPDGLHFNSIGTLPDGALVITGEAGKVIRSIDAGRRWQVLDTGYNGHLYGVLAGPAAGTLLAFGFAGHAFLSEDDGRRWQALKLPTRQALIGGFRLGKARLVLVDRERRVLYSDDLRQWQVAPGDVGRPLAGVCALANPARLAVAGVGGPAVLALNLP